MTSAENRNPARMTPTVAALRATIERLEGHKDRKRAVLPFGVAAIDGKLPGGGLRLGALHEVAGAGNDALDAAAAALFAAGIAARTKGKVLWIVTKPDLFAPALDQAGLAAGRVIHVEAKSETDVLACFEEGLRHGAPGAVVAEVARLTMTASRRLQIAAEGSGTIGIALRRRRRQSAASASGPDFGQPTASTTRWRVSVLPSAPLPVPGIGRHRWRLELLRARSGALSGEGADFEVEACDATGKLGPAGVAVPAALAGGAGQEEARRASA